MVLPSLLLPVSVLTIPAIVGKTASPIAHATATILSLTAMSVGIHPVKGGTSAMISTFSPTRIPASRFFLCFILLPSMILMLSVRLFSVSVPFCRILNPLPYCWILLTTPWPCTGSVRRSRSVLSLISTLADPRTFPITRVSQLARMVSLSARVVSE